MRTLVLASFLLSHFSYGITLYDGEQAEQFADQRLAQKLERVYLSPDNTSKQFSQLVGLEKTQTFNQDGTPFSSNLTGSHDSVESLCQKWAGPRNCVQWLAPYIPDPVTHASDASAEETVVLQGYKETMGDRGGNGQYALWNVSSRNGGSYLRQDGSLNPEALGKYSLKDKYKNGLKEAGARTGKKSLEWTFDTTADAQEKNATGSEEARRAIAAALTQNYRNRMIDIIGRGRAAKTGIEVLQGINIPDCASYAGAVAENFDQYRQEMKTDPQRNLAYQTRNIPIDERIKRCEQVKKMSAYATNVGVYDGEVQAGDPNGERIDVALAQANLLAIDKVGVDARNFPLPQGVQVSDEDVKSTIADCKADTLNCKDVQQTNATDLKQYNKAIREAQQSIRKIASVNKFVNADQAEDMSKWEIKEGQMNAVTLNGLTPDQRSRIRNTGSPLAQGNQANDPGNNLEQAPVDLVVTNGSGGL